MLSFPQDSSLGEPPPEEFRMLKKHVSSMFASLLALSSELSCRDLSSAELTSLRFTVEDLAPLLRVWRVTRFT